MDKSQNSNNRFADYFVVCGLDLNSGLEPDKLAGIIYYLIHCIMFITYVHLLLTIYFIQVIIYIALLWNEHIRVKYWDIIPIMYLGIHLMHLLFAW